MCLEKTVERSTPEGRDDEWRSREGCLRGSLGLPDHGGHNAGVRALRRLAGRSKERQRQLQESRLGFQSAVGGEKAADTRAAESAVSSPPRTGC